MNFIDTIKQYIAGKKTYITAVVAILMAAVAWGVGEISNIQAIVALYAALQTIFIRAGIAKAPSAREIIRIAEDVVDEDAYSYEASAHARLMEAQAENQEAINESAKVFRNAPNSDKK